MKDSNSEAAVRLFCFPWAGGGASVYRSWSARFPKSIEVCPVQLPGREDRIMEAPFNRLPPLIESIQEALTPYLDRPYAFFGSSVGAFLSFELARRLRHAATSGPACLFVAGCGAPQIPDPSAHIHGLSEAEFIEALRKLDGIPEEVLNSRELLELVIPTVRADYTVHETYEYSDEPPLECPIVAFGGRVDPTVDARRMRGWRVQTSVSFEMQIFPGGHFFLAEAQADITETILEVLRTSLSSDLDS